MNNELISNIKEAIDTMKIRKDLYHDGTENNSIKYQSYMLKEKTLKILLDQVNNEPELTQEQEYEYYIRMLYIIDE